MAINPFTGGVIPGGITPTGGTAGTASTPATSTAAPSSQAVSDLLSTIGQGNTATATAQSDTATQQEDQLAQQGDLLSQQGYGTEASAYGSAASIAATNASLATISGQIQAQQTARKVFQTQSSTAAETAGNGFGAGGGSVYLMASNAQQGALAEQMDVEQGEIQALGYQEQGEAATAEQAAVEEAGTAAGVAAQGEGIAAAEAGTQAGQATTAAQASYTNSQNAITSLVANTGGINAPNNTILQGIQTSLNGSLASPGTLANPILNYAGVPSNVANSTFGGTTAVGPTGGALNGGGGGIRVVGANAATGGLGPSDALGGTLGLASDPNFGID